mgnify:FL=1
MANIFFTGEKDSKEQAIKSVSDFIKDYSECVFEAVVVSDDGGHMLQVMVEVGDSWKGVLEQHPGFPLWEVMPKWHGWRTVILKVPVGYLATIYNKRDDD